MNRNSVWIVFGTEDGCTLVEYCWNRGANASFGVKEYAHLPSSLKILESKLETAIVSEKDNVDSIASRVNGVCVINRTSKHCIYFAEILNNENDASKEG